MNLQQLTLKVQQLTQQLQQTQDLAKKISELPLQSILDPASLLHVSRNGISEKLTVQKIIESASSLAFNRLLFVGDFILEGNSFTVPELAQWLIENVIFQNALSVSFNVPFSASARIRRDVIFGNNQGQILRQVGLEISNDGIEPPKPAIPPNTVEITSFTVTDSVIGLPDAPIIGVDAITKLSQGWLIRPFSGPNVRLTASDPSKSYELTNDDLVSIDGINTTGFSNDFEWDGQEFVLFRNAATPVTLNFAVDDFNLMPFSFTNGTDFVMAPKSFAKFKRRGNIIYLISYSVITENINTDDQKNIIEDTTLDNSHNRNILKVKENSTVKIPLGLAKNFNCVFDCWDATMTLEALPGVTITEEALNLEPGKMATLYKDGELEVYKFKGEAS